MELIENTFENIIVQIDQITEDITIFVNSPTVPIDTNLYKGDPGVDGVGITSIVNNINGTITINLSDGSSYTTNDLTGAPGSPGSPGVKYYTWIKYADDIVGNGLSNDPTGKSYIGFAYNKTTPAEGSNPADYTFSKLTGGPGVPGPPGTKFWTWIRYSDYPDGSNLYDIPNDNTIYIGISPNRDTPTESNDKTDYVWSKFKGDDGVAGQDGKQGPGIVFRGEFDPSKTYYNNDIRRDAVKHAGAYYLYTGPDGTMFPWSLSRWEPFGAQFESVATNLLLAESANIADWIIVNGKIQSQNGTVTLYGKNGKIHLTGVSIDGDNDQSIISDDGIIITSEGTPVNPTLTGYDQDGNPINLPPVGIKAALVGKAKSSNPSFPVVGVYGKATNVGHTGLNDSFGGYFEGGLMSKDKFILKGANYVNGITIYGNTTLGAKEQIVICYNAVTCTINLPSIANLYLWREIIIKRAKATVLINGNGKSIYSSVINSGTYAISVAGEAMKLVYDGSYWQLFNMR